jgi:hypothetical protein
VVIFVVNGLITYIIKHLAYPNSRERVYKKTNSIASQHSIPIVQREIEAEEMKFLNIVPWGRRSAQLDQVVTRTSLVPAMVSAEPSVPAPLDTKAVWSDMAEKKRRRSSGHGKTWRPSLDAISENAALRGTPAMAAGKERTGKNRAKKVKVKGSVTIYTGSDDLRLVLIFLLFLFS